MPSLLNRGLGRSVVSPSVSAGVGAAAAFLAAAYDVAALAVPVAFLAPALVVRALAFAGAFLAAVFFEGVFLAGTLGALDVGLFLAAMSWCTSWRM